MKFDNEVIIEFLGKAQSKIGELGSYVAERKHDKSSSELLKELIDVVKALLHCNNTWTEARALEIVNYYNVKAELNNVPYLNVIGYEIKLVKTTIGGSKTTSVNDLVDYVSKTTELISQAQHNLFKGIQGGKAGEYYHLSKEEYDKLIAILYPFISPTVSLSMFPSTSIREKGTSYTGTTLTGSYVLNSGKSVKIARYFRNNVLQAEYTGGSVSNNYVDNSIVSGDTTFKYEVEFEVGGVLSASKSVSFVLPYYSQIIGMNELIPGSILATNLPNKVLGSKPSQVNVSFTLPANNATTREKTAALYIPKSYGAFTKIYVDNNSMFDYINEWEVLTVNIVLPDMTSEEYYVYRFKEATEGTFNFNFKWQ